MPHTVLEHAKFIFTSFVVSACSIGFVSFAEAASSRATSVSRTLATANPVAPSDPTSAVLLKVNDLVRKGQLDTALKRLRGDWGQQLSQNQADAIAGFLRARILEDLKRDTEAATEYVKALEKRSSLEAQLRFALGKLHARNGQTSAAREVFTRVLKEDKKELPNAIRTRATLELARAIALESEKLEPKAARPGWTEVVKTLQPAMKSARNQDIYPSYMYQLLRAKRRLGQTDCRLARDLYSKYPAATEIADWGPLMPNNKLENQKLSCSVTSKEIQTRLRRLQLQGQIDRSIIEIHNLKTTGVFDSWTLDSFEIGALLANGQNQDAMKILLRHAETQKTKPQFWNLFGRVTSRLGDFAASAGAYKKSYQLAPKGKSASDALFNSAFASYQMQDYDGAEESFGLLSSRYGRAKMARDARWHLAWMSYLRGDYETALERWRSLLNERVGRRQARGDSTSPDRIQYWSAMALTRLGREKEAVEVFKKLLRDPAIDYYAILSWYRLKATPSVKLTEAENRLGAAAAVAEQELRETIAVETLDAKVEAAKAKAEADPAPETALAAAESSGDAPTVESAAEGDESGSDLTNSEGDSADGELPEGGLPLDAGRVDVRDPALRPRLERVRQLYAAGFEDETRWELQNLDQRVRNPQDRRMMMAELHRMGRFDRSSTLGELAFSGPRLRGGLDGARDLWEYTYPKAWTEAVQAAAKSTRVDEDLIWSIMRAESHYRPDVRSPVGASGLMQIMPFTGERVASQLLGQGGFKADDLLDPELNIRYGSRYLQRLHEKFSGSLPLIAASYNAGPHRVQAWLRGFGALRMDEFIEHIPFVETRNYVKKVTRNFQIYRRLYREDYGRDDKGGLGWLVQPVGVTPDTGPNALEVW